SASPGTPCRRRAAARQTWWPRRTAPSAAPMPKGRACRHARPWPRRRAASPSAAPRSRSARAACRAAARRRSFARLQRRIDQAREVVAALDRFVVDEAQLRRGVHLDALGELRAQEAGGAAQALECLRQLFPVEHGEEDLGVRDVGRHVDRGDGDHAHARVAQLQPDQIGDFPLDQVAQPLRAALPSLHSVLATSTVSNTSNWSFSFTSVKFLSDMPHSKPALTSRTSSLKRLSESMSPVWMTTLSRSTRTWALRLTRPSCT